MQIGGQGRLGTVGSRLLRSFADLLDGCLADGDSAAPPAGGSSIPHVIRRGGEKEVNHLLRFVRAPQWHPGDSWFASALIEVWGLLGSPTQLLRIRSRVVRCGSTVTV